HARVLDLELRLGLAALARLVGDPRVRVRDMRILVERLEVRRRRSRVEVVVELLAVLAVVALGPGEAEQTLLQDRIAAVPDRRRHADAALAVAQAQEAVFPPSIDA